MLYNIAVKISSFPKLHVVIGISETDLGRFVEAYKVGKDKITINGEKINIVDPILTKIFNVTKRISPTSANVVKEDLQRLANFYYRGVITLECLAELGDDITNQFITDEWGSNQLITSIELIERTEVKNVYINIKRIEELKEITKNNFDLTKLIRLCEEINETYSNSLYFATGALVRVIIDHVPPIFGFSNFDQVVSNYSAGGRARSFKDSMDQLNKSMRKISDRIVHSHITISETLPNETQIDCKRELDALLEEIVRILK